MTMSEMNDQYTLNQQAWENARNIISNENNLARNRMTAFLTLQGLLFTAFGLGFRIYLNKSELCLLVISIYLFQFLISITGCIAAYIFYDILRRAHKHIDATRFWFYYYWQEINKVTCKSVIEECGCPPFPCLTGGGRFEDDYTGYYDTIIESDYVKKLKGELIKHDNKHKGLLPKRKKESNKIESESRKFFDLGSLSMVKFLGGIWFILFVAILVSVLSR